MDISKGPFREDRDGPRPRDPELKYVENPEGEFFN